MRAPRGNEGVEREGDSQVRSRKYKGEGMVECNWDQHPPEQSISPISAVESSRARTESGTLSPKAPVYMPRMPQKRKPKKKRDPK